MHQTGHLLGESAREDTLGKEDVSEIERTLLEGRSQCAREDIF